MRDPGSDTKVAGSVAKSGESSSAMVGVASKVAGLGAHRMLHEQSRLQLTPGDRELLHPLKPSV